MLLLTNKTIEKLKHDLVREGFVNLEGLMLAQENAQKNNTNLAVELVKENLIDEKTLLQFIESKLHIPFVDLNDYTPDINCLSYISAQQAQNFNIFPLFKIEDVLTIAMSDPLDLFTINTLFEFSDITIEPVVCAENSIKTAINEYYFKKPPASQNTNWQNMIISENLSDEILKETIFDIIKDAINQNYNYVFMERSQAGLNLFFNKELKGFIPNLLVPRFLFELKNIVKLQTDEIDEIDEIPQNSKFIITQNGKNYSLLTSVFPTKFGERISIVINKPLKSIEQYNLSKEKLNGIIASPALIGLAANKNDINLFAYAIAEYLSENYSVLMAESNIKYDLANVTQVEYHQNTALNFDEIINQIDLQNFEILFFEKIYTKTQAKKLKMLANERVIFTSSPQENFKEFDFVITTEGKIL